MSESLKQCRDCEMFLPEERFGKDRRKFDGLRPYCKECVSVRRSGAYKNSKLKQRPISCLPKVCTQCNAMKPASEFYTAKDVRDGLASWCKRCTIEKFHAGFNDASRSAQLKYYYGISVEQYEEMLKTQNGVCAFCKRLDKVRLAVDHDHETGAVRGLLCGKCNKGLGLFDDDIERLLVAVEYLRRHLDVKPYQERGYHGGLGTTRQHDLTQ